jgi:hypothetical protein
MHEVTVDSMNKVSRRTFSFLALWSIISAPALVGQRTKEAIRSFGSVALPLEGEVSGVPKQVLRKALHQTESQIAMLRAYALERDTPPALILGVFESPQMFAREGIKNAR